MKVLCVQSGNTTTWTTRAQRQSRTIQGIWFEKWRHIRVWPRWRRRWVYQALCSVLTKVCVFSGIQRVNTCFHGAAAPPRGRRTWWRRRQSSIMVAKVRWGEACVVVLGTMVGRLLYSTTPTSGHGYSLLPIVHSFLDCIIIVVVQRRLLGIWYRRMSWVCGSYWRDGGMRLNPRRHGWCMWGNTCVNLWSYESVSA